jgi:DNA-directed RNA polymerase subunit E'/Rpb7
MEQTVLFEEKIHLSPKDMNRVAKQSIDSIILDYLRSKLGNRCSQHGFVNPESLKVLSRSMGLIENGRYTGNVVYHVQAEGTVLNPANGTRITGTILKKNKMGLYIVYKDAIRILIPRDLHIGNEEFEQLETGDTIEVEIRKSRFQILDQFILSVGVFITRTEVAQPPVEKPALVAAPVAAVAAPSNSPQDSESEAEEESNAGESEAEEEANVNESEAEAEEESEDENASEAEVEMNEELPE